jgi:hypothetical protein
MPTAWSSGLPVMKAEFPLPAAAGAQFFDALRLPVPALPRVAYALDQFIATLRSVRRVVGREVRDMKQLTGLDALFLELESPAGFRGSFTAQRSRADSISSQWTASSNS